MDEFIWKVIRLAIKSADRSIPRAGRRPRYGDALIVRMYFWAVAHDRPLCWACRRSSYGRMMRPRAIPSVSQFCKRVRSQRVQAVIDRVFELLSGRDEHTALACIDGKALPIGDATKDPDAGNGRGGGRFSRGYKAHVLADSLGRIRHFHITPIQVGEPPVARERLVGHIPRGCVVLADANYDGRELYADIGGRGAFLLTPQKKNRRTEAAFRKTSPERRAAMELWRDHPTLARRAYALRAHIERVFSALTCFGGGLAPLPAWVRRAGRVRRWVTAKIAIYNARVLVRNAPS